MNRDEVFEAYSRDDREYREAYTRFDEIYRNFQQTGGINKQNLIELKELENRMDQLGKELDNLRKIILKWATGEEPVPVE